MEKVLFKPWIIKFAPFGSQVVGCATEKSDYDYVILCKRRPDEADMEGTGFENDASDPLYGQDFSSWRKGDVNLVFTDSRFFFDAAVEATAFCKKYKIYDKEDRCKVHMAFRKNT